MTLSEVMTKIAIPNANEVRGNITLIKECAGAKINWKSSRPDVITDKDNGDLAAGVVTRQKEDCKVTLTAEITYAGETTEKEYEVCVIAAPEKILDTDYEGYLFGHFIGEGDENQEQIYFALSEDGMHFKDMNGKKPVLRSNIGEKGVRDPYLCRSAEGDRFFLVATDLSIYNRGGWVKNEQGYYDASTTGSENLVLWESLDLVHWTEPKLLPIAPANAGMAWAPEMVYYEKTGEYIIFFASSIMDPATKMKAKPNAIYYAATRDFVHFSETKIFIDNQVDGAEDGKPREIIDTTVIKVGEYYYSASKDGDNAEKNGGIRIMRTKDLLDYKSWEKVMDLDELSLDLSGQAISVLDNSSLEGPELFRYNQKDWADKAVPEYGLIADQYMADGGYLPLTTTDISDATNANNSWKLLSKEEYSFDQLKKRHGTILCITKKEMDELKKVYEK